MKQTPKVCAPKFGRFPKFMLVPKMNFEHALKLVLNVLNLGLVNTGNLMLLQQ